MPIKIPSEDRLVDLTVSIENISEAIEHAKTLPRVHLSERALCDLELLAVGGFSPVDRFMGYQDYVRVVEEMRLNNGQLFPIPVTLPVTNEEPIKFDQEVALVDLRNEIVATMTTDEIYKWDLKETAQQVFGTTDERHPLVAEMNSWGTHNIAGQLKVIRLPAHFDFRDLRLTPRQTRSVLQRTAFENVVAFQTRNPLHRGHEEITKRAIHLVDGILLLHPVVGMTNPGDIDHVTRVRTYKAFAQTYPDPERILLALVPLAMRMAGPREALWHALIRRNYGANHIIIGRDHASPGNDSTGNAFYPPYAAQEIVQQFEAELGVKALTFGEFVYLPDEDRYEEMRSLGEQVTAKRISGTQGREWYRNGNANLPAWFVRPEIADLIAQTYPPRHKQGFCVWFTGLSAAGKSTTAEILTARLQEHGRQVTLLDGDIVRTHLSLGLGFSRHDRDLNIKRIGFVAGEIVRHHGAVICAAVSPYRTTRNEVRNMVGADRFIEVFVDTPLEECERRDTKGMYVKARQGDIKNFTGIDDPYEAPLNPELRIETMNNSVEQNVDTIVTCLRDRGWIN